MKIKHTAVPWHYDEDEIMHRIYGPGQKQSLAIVATKEDKKFIAHTANSFYQMLDALKIAFRYGQFEDKHQLKMIEDAIYFAEERQ